MLSNLFSRSFLSSVAVSLFLFSFFISSVRAQEDNAALMVVSGRITLTKSGEAAEGVEIEIKKNGEIISKTTSGKKGKYSFQIKVSTSNPANDYIVYYSQVGTVPKILTINAYLSKTEFAQHSFVRFDKELDISMLETTVKDIVLEKPQGKMRWDEKVHDFEFDQTYAKLAQKEDQKMLANPDQYFKDLAKKKKKEEALAAKKKAAEDAKLKAEEEALLKAEEEAKRIADQKAKEEADRILQQNLEAMKKEMQKKHIQDSLDNLARMAGETKVEIKKIVKPVLPDDEGSNIYDGTSAYSINIARNSLNAFKQKMNKEKAQNLSFKYETNNTLTSLLDMVDEHDKKLKKP